MADYDMEKEVYELNFEGARLAKEACAQVTAKDPTRPRFVVGALGPTNRTGSISPVGPVDCFCPYCLPLCPKSTIQPSLVFPLSKNQN